MQPRTKRHKEVFDLSKIVLNVNDKIEKWAQKECNDHIAFAMKSRYWCTNCGAIHHKSVLSRKTISCPRCRQKLQVKASRVRKHFQKYFVGFAEVLGEYQVIRLFKVYSNHRMGNKASTYVHECIMQFVPQDHNTLTGKVTYVARKRNMGQGYPTSGDLEIREPRAYDHWLYNPYPYKFHPHSQFKDQYTKYGINHELQGLTFLTAARVVPTNPKAETLLKAKQYHLFGECSERPSKIHQYWRSIKIAIRHKYYVEDSSVWLDHLDSLLEAGKDIHNPKFICSPTLMEDHNRMVAKKRAQQEKIAKELARQRRIENRQRRILEMEMNEKKRLQDIENFEKSKGCFFGLEFKKGRILVRVLESIDEFKEEAHYLHHCVYSNKYFNKEKSLLFSATMNGDRLETVEVSLESMSVIQCRGKHNQFSKYHDDIVDLVNRNMYQIAMRMEGDQKNVG